MNQLIRKLKATCSVALLASALGLGLPAHAIVYTASNEATGNHVIAFDADERGNPVELGRFDTKGIGTGSPLGNQAAMATDAGDRWLFVVNPGDGTVTSMRLLPQGLEFVNRVDSGGARPLSVTVFGTLVYVLNEGDGVSSDPYLHYDNISGFRFNGGGELEPIPDSTRILDRTQLTAPAQVGFNKSGTVLLVTEKATNKLTTYVMQDDGTPEDTPRKRTSAVPTPFGFNFGDRDYVLVTEANGGGQGVTASYRIDRETGAISALVDKVELGNATCWTVLSSDQTIGYATNTASGTLSMYVVNFDGTLDHFFNAGVDIPIPAGGGVRDAVLTQDNHFLFTLNNGDSQLRGYFVNRGGVVAPRGTVPIPPSATGLVAR